MSQRTILVAQAARFIDLMMKFKMSPVVRKIKLMKSKSMQKLQRNKLEMNNQFSSSTPTPPPPTTQAQVINASESDSSLKFEQRILELEKRIEAIPKRAWIVKDQKWTDAIIQMIDNLLLKRRFKRSLECYVGGRTNDTYYILHIRTI
ncbi:hypothetical protein Tco_1336250 [Tanacetum coccineum]